MMRRVGRDATDGQISRVAVCLQDVTASCKSQVFVSLAWCQTTFGVETGPPQPRYFFCYRQYTISNEQASAGRRSVRTQMRVTTHMSVGNRRSVSRTMSRTSVW